jgi:hypothetical protein
MVSKAHFGTQFQPLTLPGVVHAAIKAGPKPNLPQEPELPVYGPPQQHEMTQEEFGNQHNVMWHATANGMIDPANIGFHVGNYDAAEDRLREQIISAVINHKSSQAIANYKKTILALKGNPNFDKSKISSLYTTFIHKNSNANKAETDDLKMQATEWLVKHAKETLPAYRPTGHNGTALVGEDRPKHEVYSSNPKIVPGIVDSENLITPYDLAMENPKWAMPGSRNPNIKHFDDHAANILAATKAFKKVGKGALYENQVEGIKRNRTSNLSAVLPNRNFFRTHEDALIEARAAKKKIPDRAYEGYTEIPGQGSLF